MIGKKRVQFSLLAVLDNTKVAFVGDDGIFWPHDPSGKFIIKSYCGEMYKGLNHRGFPDRAIWKSKNPHQSMLSCFSGHQRKGSNKEMLQRRYLGVQCIVQRKRRLTFISILSIVHGLRFVAFVII